MVKRLLLSLGCKDKKGFAFTMDVGMAIIVVLLVLTVASFFAVRVTKDPLVNLQLLRVGEDFANIIDYKGYLSPPNEGAIETFLSNSLPAQYSMYFEGSGETGCNFIVGTEPEEDKIVGAGKKFFNVNNNFCTLSYKIWLK